MTNVTNTNLSKKQRPALPFEMPDITKLTFATEAEFNEHQNKTLDMVDANNDGFPWVDSYLIGFGYKTISPFLKFIEEAPNSISGLTGQVVVTMEDYLDHVYAFIEEEQAMQQLLDNKAPLQQRGYKSEQSEVNGAYPKWVQACKERRTQLAVLWENYQEKIRAKKEAEEFHKSEVKLAYEQYMQLKNNAPKREDFK